MKTTKIIFVYLFCGLSFLVRGQQVGNYVSNGSFEEMYDCTNQQITNAKYWRSIDSINSMPLIFSTCSGMMTVPLNSFTYQWPKFGENYVAGTQYSPPPVSLDGDNRNYLRNRLKRNLNSGKTYCISFYVNITSNSTSGIDALGAYFGDDNLDTITHGGITLTYLSPQIENSTNNIITDTLNWVLITGTFVANGNEKHLVLGNFKSDNTTNTLVINPNNLPYNATDVCFDNVSCIELNLPAYAGPNRAISLGDSTYIGRESDFAIDPGCIWYKLPNTTTAIDTSSGIWVKPTSTSTYVVKQVLDCSPEKWDTVVVYMNMVGVDKLQTLSDKITLFPNPTTGNLSISAFIGSDNTTFSINNCLGQNVLNGHIIQKNNLINIETSELESGLYQIHLKTQYGIVTKKFVKTN